MGAPVGPAGAALSCGAPEDAPDPPTRRLALGTTFTGTELDFSTGDAYDMRRAATSLSLGYRLGENWTLIVGGGASWGGDLVTPGRRVTIDPGWLAVGGASFRVLDGSGYKPFLTVGITGSISSSSTAIDLRRAQLTAIDGRVSLSLGKLLLGAIAPYVVARGFGGPIFWQIDGRDVVGTDRNHVQIGAGTLVTAGVVDAYFEIVPLGERALSFGAAARF